MLLNNVKSKFVGYVKNTFYKKSFLRFLLLGGMNTILTLLIYWLLILFYGHNTSYATAFIIGILFSYAANSVYTFKTKIELKRLPLYIIGYVLSYLFGSMILNISVGEFGIHKQVAIFLVIGLSIPVNYIISHFILKPRNT